MPEYPKPNGDRVTLHQLLNHISGIPGSDTPRALPELTKAIQDLSDPAPKQ